MSRISLLCLRVPGCQSLLEQVLARAADVKAGELVEGQVQRSQSSVSAGIEQWSIPHLVPVSVELPDVPRDWFE
jgi:hypothetical protein